MYPRCLPMHWELLLLRITFGPHLTRLAILMVRFKPWLCVYVWMCSLQARVSDDYSPGNSQWKIGISSMVAHGLGIAPFKDDFWTTSDQPGNPKYGGKASGCIPYWCCAVVSLLHQLLNGCQCIVKLCFCSTVLNMIEPTTSHQFGGSV